MEELTKENISSVATIATAIGIGGEIFKNLVGVSLTLSPDSELTNAFSNQAIVENTIAVAIFNEIKP